MDRKEEDATPSTAVSSEYNLPIDGKFDTKVQEDSDVERNTQLYKVPQWKLILLRDIAVPGMAKASYHHHPHLLPSQSYIYPSRRLSMDQAHQKTPT